MIQLSIIRLLQYDWLSGYWWVINTVTCAMETRFMNLYSTFFVAADKWMHPKYHCGICKYLICIYAKFYNHISPNYYKPDVPSMKLCCRSSDWIFSWSRISGTANCRWIQLSQYWSYCYNFVCILLWILFIWKPSEILMIFELFLCQTL